MLWSPSRFSFSLLMGRVVNAQPKVLFVFAERPFRRVLECFKILDGLLSEVKQKHFVNII